MEQGGHGKFCADFDNRAQQSYITNVTDINCKELSSIYPVLISSSFDHVLLLHIRFM